MWTVRKEAAAAAAAEEERGRRSGGGGGAGGGPSEEFRYQMVLRLVDSLDETIWIGAPLLEEAAETFFAGLPPVDLTKANATLKACVEETGSCTVGHGAAEAHAPADREAAARKLISNHVRVLHDLTNTMGSNIDNKALTQPALRRVAPAYRPLVDGFLRSPSSRRSS